MADKRGGNRRPSDRGAKVSGVGKNSKRTDTQAIKSPNVQDSADLQVGDRERIRQGQQVQPLASAPSPLAPASGSPRPPAGGGRPLQIPPHLLGMPSTRPDEDILTPTAPPDEPLDDMEVVLQFLVNEFQDENANRMLQEHRTSRQAPELPAPVPASQPVPVPEATGEIEPSTAFEQPAPVEETGGEESPPLESSGLV